MVLELHYMLALSKGQLYFEIIQVSYVLSYLMALNMNLSFVKIF